MNQQTYFSIQKATKARLQKKAFSLIQTFLFFSPEEIDTRVKKLKYLPIKALNQLITVLEEGHKKQTEYLELFAQKDPNLLYHFKLLVNKARIHDR